MNKHLTVFMFLSFLFSISIFAQELKDKKDKNQTISSINYIDEAAATDDKMTVKDEDGNVLMEVTDEGEAGSIYLKPLSLITSSTNKIYNIGSALYWNGTALGTAGSAGGWTDDGEVVRLSDIGDKVGIGTATPNVALHVAGNTGVLFEKTSGFAVIPKEGSGTRMMWYPYKAAFRVGDVEGTQWDDVNIGNSSFAAGYDTKASGFASTAMGATTSANSEYSTAVGINNVGGGSGDTWIATDPLFEVGNGYTDKSNAMTVLKNGNVGITTPTPTAALHVSGDDGVLFEGTFGSGSIPKEGAGARMMWYPKKAAFRAGYATGSWNDEKIGDQSIAMGYSTTASGVYSLATGYETTASGEGSTAMGYISLANSLGSTAMGQSIASGEFSTAIGKTFASGNYSTAMGSNAKANSFASTAIGYYNVGGGTPNSWVDTDPLFEIGNGYAPRSNAMTVLKNGNVGIGTGISLANNVRLTIEGYENFYSLIKINQKGTKEYAGLSVQRNDTEKWFIGMDRYDDNLQFRNSSSTNFITIKEDGNVGIGTTSPSRKLYVNGSAGGTEQWNGSSDERLKKNIATIPNALEKVNNLRGVNFEWRETENHSKGLQMGFIAQEAKDVIPEVVSKSGEYYSMQYASITALLVEAVKEQNKEFRTQNAELKIRVEQLEKIISELVKNRNTKLTSVLK